MMNKKRLEAKRNHHHVWANYMKRWSPNNRDIYYTTKNKKIAFDSVRNIAVEKDFYRVGHLTQEHIELIKRFSSLADKDLHNLHMSYLSDFILIQHYEEIYKKQKRRFKEIDKQLEALRSNGIENYHTAHENDVQHILESLANRDLAILDVSNNMIKFMMFYAHQITRTKTFRDNIKIACSRANDATGNNFNKILEESWWFLGYMFGMNIGRSLYLNRKEDVHCLLLNDTDTPFITSDQPSINVHHSYTKEVKPPEDNECDHYFPISPNVAYMINKSNRFPEAR